MEKERLFEKFPPVSTEEWIKKINADLKGADFDKKLVWKTAEGIDLKPFYRAGDTISLIGDNLPGEFPYRRGSKQTGNSWLIRQDLKISDYRSANLKALEILMRGVNSIGFIIEDPESVYRQNIETLLKDIHPEAIELNFLCNGKAKEILGILSDIFAGKSFPMEALSGAIEADPLGRLMVNGTLCIPPKAGFDYLTELTKSALGHQNFRTMHLRVSDFNNAGADIVQELAYAVSMGNEYLVQLTERGLSAVDIASKIRFSFGIGPNYFLEIAKLRAARILWSAVLKRHITDDSIPSMKIHCITSRWNKTAYDPYVNMLRTQTEAMSAVLGGTDSLTIEAFDAPFKNPDAFSERIARNQQLILKEEAGFGNVADPAAGSYYIENLTDMLAEAAWKLFLETESEGGFLSALQKGVIQKKVSESASRKQKDLASRKTVLLGTNQFPNNRENISGTIDKSVLLRNGQAAGSEVEPVKMFRGAADYENIRLAVEESGKKPHVFLLTIGDPVMRKARAQFSSVFFGCAGYEITDNSGFDTLEAGVSAAIDSKADIVVICSSDEEYLSLAPEVYRNLGNKSIVVVAGNPACAGELKTAGIEHFIHMRSDVPMMLNFFNSKLGIYNNR